ncbi:putative transferase [Mycobacterium kansasii]|uniref:Putative transferase n=1 Tax=Mycobacterium kansasii TaxID=1768 RepID=A0A1V3XA74_MYCKA|nr:putative transferase [Mycobacterium kansasii]
MRAVAAYHDRVVMLVGPRGRDAAELLVGVDEIVQWQAPWVDFDSPELTAAHADGLVKQLRDIAPARLYIFTSFHQSPLPLALLAKMASVPWVGAISTDYPGALLDLRHQAPSGVPEPQRALSLTDAAGCPLPPATTARCGSGRLIRCRAGCRPGSGRTPSWRSIPAPPCRRGNRARTVARPWWRRWPKPGTAWSSPVVPARPRWPPRWPAMRPSTSVAGPAWRSWRRCSRRRAWSWHPIPGRRT